MYYDVLCIYMIYIYINVCLYDMYIVMYIIFILNKTLYKTDEISHTTKQSLT